MRHPLPAVVAALVLAATVATGAPVAPPGPADQAAGTAGPTGQATATARLATGVADIAATPIVTLQNSTSYLAIPAGERERQTLGDGTIDVAGTAAVESGRLHDQFLVSATLQAFDAAANDTARTAVIRRAVGDLENRSVALLRDQQRAIHRFNEEAISTDAFLRELAVIDQRARELESFLGTILQVTSRRHGYSLPNQLRSRIHNARADPILLQGPVRSAITAAMRGAGNVEGVLVRTSEDGVVLAQATGDEFYREAFLADKRQSGRDNFAAKGNPLTVAANRARSLYPWAFNNTINYAGRARYGQTSVYLFNIDHTQGTLTSYIDGTTTNAFREIQENRLAALPIATDRQQASDNLSVRAELTHATGPVRVTVTDPDTGENVDASVTVDGQFVGRTGSDGQLWTVHPGVATTINATTAAGRSVSVDLPAGPTFGS